MRRGLTLLQLSGERNAQTPFCEFKVYSGRFDTCGYCESATTAGPASTFPSSVTPSSGGENIRDLPSQRRPHWQCRAVNRPVPELPRLTPPTHSLFPSQVSAEPTHKRDHTTLVLRRLRVTCFAYASCPACGSIRVAADRTSIASAAKRHCTVSHPAGWTPRLPGAAAAENDAAVSVGCRRFAEPLIVFLWTNAQRWDRWALR